MTAEIGQYALILALMVSAVGGVLTLAGAELASRSWMRVGMAAAAVFAVLATSAIGALVWGFVESDFSILNVARNSNIALPWYYKLAAVWGSHEGSILFWVTTLAWWIFAVALSARHLPERVLARILGTLFIITFGLYLFILTTSNPFLRLFPPAEAGADLNPLLQDPGMIFHPPLLYLGYVGFAVPFAFAVAALLGAIIAFCVTKFFMTPMYQASAKLYVLNSSGTSLNLSQIQLSSSLASDYVQVFDNWHVHEMVKRRLNLDYTYAQMGKMISVENPTNTRILKVTVQSDDPQEAADMALTYVQVAREFIAAKMDMDMPTIFEEPQLPTRPYSPSTMKNTVLGFLLGLLLMCGIVVVQFLADDRVRNADKLEKQLGLATIGMMPVQSYDLSREHKNGKEGK